MTKVTVHQLRQALSAADFPATKDQLLEVARQQGASPEVGKALRSLPPVDYGSAAEVIRSVTVDVVSGPRPSPVDDIGVVQGIESSDA